MGGHDTRLKSEQENQSNQRSTQTTPAPVLGLRTASYCTENEWTPKPNKNPRVPGRTLRGERVSKAGSLGQVVPLLPTRNVC